MATYPTDATGLFTTDGFSSMADHKPDKGFSTDEEFNSIIFESEAGYERRRLRSRRSKRAYSFSYTNVNGLVKNAIETFYRDRSGNFESFTLDLTHLSDSGNVTVRFDGPLNQQHVLSSDNSNILQSFYTISFKVKEVFG